MSNKATKPIINPLGSLCADCATRCEAYAACGGNRGPFPWAVPCGCAWTASSEMRHKCEDCSLVCRERRKKGPNGLEPDFAPHINAGRLLEQVNVHQNSDIQLPLFVPTNTQALKDMQLPLQWAAADVRMLFNTRGVRRNFLTHHSTHEHLRVGPECNLIAVLNGKDSYLEQFWALKRGEALKQLRSSGFSMGTGATFSVNELTHEGTPMPYSHNAAMLARHHRVITEIQAADMEAIPNLYWIDGDQREIQRWAEWLTLNKQIRTVTRDFSSTSRDSTSGVMNKLRELISLLALVGRSFHVVIVGTGCNLAPQVLKELAKAGHSGTVVTAAPLLAGHFNVMYQLDDNGLIVDEQLPDQLTPFPKLMWHNMQVFERVLFDAVSGTAVESKARPNVLTGGF